MYRVDRDLIFTEILLPNSIFQDDSEVYETWLLYLSLGAHDIISQVGYPEVHDWPLVPLDTAESVADNTDLHALGVQSCHS